jgi:hypothetical protein
MATAAKEDDDDAAHGGVAVNAMVPASSCATNMAQVGAISPSPGS